MSDEREAEQGFVSGRVDGEAGVLVVRVQIEAEGRRHEAEKNDGFSLAGGVEVAVTSHTVLLPERQVEGTFGELLDDPLCDPVMDHAPGDHVDTTLRGNVLKAGDEVTVYGDLVYTLKGEGGYRDAAAKEVAAVRAIAIAVGADGEAQLRGWQEETRRAEEEQEARPAVRETVATPPEKAKDPLAAGPVPLTQVWVYAAITVAVLAWAVQHGRPVLLEQYRLRAVNLLWLAATTLVGTTAYIWRCRRWMPHFHPVDGGDAGRGIAWQVGGWLVPHALVATLVIVLISPLGLVGFAAVAALGLVFPIMVIKRDQRSANTALALLRAKPLQSELPDKRFGRIEGSLEGGLDYERVHGVATNNIRRNRYDAEGRHYVANVQGTWETWTETTRAQGTARLRPQGAETIDLQLHDAEWAAADFVVSYPKKVDPSVAYLFRGSDYARKNRILHLQRRPILTQKARTGDSVVAAARVRRDGGSPTMQSTGPSSFVLFTAPEGQSARAVLRRELLLHYLGLALMMVSVAAPIVFALSR